MYCGGLHVRLFSGAAEKFLFTRLFDFDLNSANFHWRRWRWARRFVRSGARRRSNKVLAKQRSRAGVVENSGHEFVRAFIDAGAAPDHLMKQNRRMEIAEENDIAHTR